MSHDPLEPSGDPYSRVEYRRLIAWPRRIRREWPLLRRLLEQAPAPSVLDLGCGTGEHARFLNSHGFRVLGVDASESMLAAALDQPLPDGLEFVAGRIQRISEIVDSSFGAAICLGNTLPHLLERSDLAELFAGLAERLLPGAPLLLQLLNYERIFERNERYLPLNFVAEDDGDAERVFLRLMATQSDGRVLFFPSTLRLDPAADSPLEVVRSNRVELRGWTAEEVEEELTRAGFDEIRRLGGFEEEAFVAAESRDLLVVARLEAAE